MGGKAPEAEAEHISDDKKNPLERSGVFYCLGRGNVGAGVTALDVGAQSTIAQRDGVTPTAKNPDLEATVTSKS